MSKFFRRGVSEIHWLPAVAGTSPIRAEITAGTNLSALIATPSGFGIANQPIPTPNLAERFTPTIDGPNETTGATSLSFYDDDASTAVRTTLATGTEGVILLLPYGDVAGKRCEVWRVKTLGVNDEDYSTGNDPARFMVSMAVLSEPEQDGVIPA